MSKNLSFGDVLAVIKHQFHTPTCRVYVRNDYVNTYLLTKFHDFSVYVISGTCNAIQDFSRDKRGNLPKRVSTRVSTDREGHVGPRLNQMGPKGWSVGPTLVPNAQRLGGYGVQEVATREPISPRWFAHKTWWPPDRPPPLN
jgi:hypothetical protein